MKIEIREVKLAHLKINALMHHFHEINNEGRASNARAG